MDYADRAKWGKRGTTRAAARERVAGRRGSSAAPVHLRVRGRRLDRRLARGRGRRSSTIATTSAAMTNPAPIANASV